MISYSPDNHPDTHYLLSYQSLREDYRRYSQMSDEEFSANLLNILHFTCITCWLKENQTQYLLGDTGLIHELVYLLRTHAELLLHAPGLVPGRRTRLPTQTPLPRSIYFYLY